MAVIYADEVYGFTVGDSTTHVWNAIEGEKNTGNTLIFRDMGSPWVMGAYVRHFDLTNLTIIFEPGCHFKKKLAADGGFWVPRDYGVNPQNHRRYRLGSRNVYPGGTEDPCEKCNTPNPVAANECSDPCGDYYFIKENATAPMFWLTRCSNCTIIAYGAEFEGVYPTDCPGTDPSTSPNSRDNSVHEFNHGFRFDLDGGADNWFYGGYIHHMGGDGINLVDFDHNWYFYDVKIEYCKRLGFSHIFGAGKCWIYDCDFSNNGKSDIAPVWGTNTRQGITIEPNNGDETVRCHYENVRMVGNSSCGLGINIAKTDNTAPLPFDMTFTKMHFEANSDQLDYSKGGAIRQNGPNMFTNVNDGEAPLGGTVSLTDIASWDEKECFIYYRGYDGKPSWSCDNMVIYKCLTLGEEVNTGQGINEWETHAGMLNGGHKFQDWNWGNTLTVHTLNEPFIDFYNSGTKFNEIASTVTGNITIASPNTQSAIVQRNGSITDNNTISKTQYTLSNFPKNVVSVSSTTDAIKDISQNGNFRFTRTGSTAWPMAVYYTISTTGTNCEHMIDFKLLRGSAVIRAGETFVDIPVVPMNPSRTGGTRQIDLTITTKSDLYTVSSPSATVFLYDTTPVGGGGDPTPIYTEEHFKLGANKSVMYLGSNKLPDRKTS